MPRIVGYSKLPPIPDPITKGNYPPFKRAHFNVIAQAIRKANLTQGQKLEIALALCEELQHTNINWNATKFLIACALKTA